MPNPIRKKKISNRFFDKMRSTVALNKMINQIQLLLNKSNHGFDISYKTNTVSYYQNIVLSFNRNVIQPWSNSKNQVDQVSVFGNHPNQISYVYKQTLSCILSEYLNSMNISYTSYEITECKIKPNLPIYSLNRKRLDFKLTGL